MDLCLPADIMELDAGYFSADRTPSPVDSLLDCQRRDLIIIPPEELTTFQDATFVIQTASGRHLNPWDLCRVTVTVVGPTGFATPVDNLNLMGDDAIICSIRPLLPGQYRLVAAWDNSEGRPITLTASRDYQGPLRRIVTWDLELPTGYSDEQAIARKPWGICCNTKTEQIWATDREHHQILLFNPDGSLAFNIGRRGSAPGEFFRPTGIAYDAARNRILVTDKDNHRVQVFDDAGRFLFAFGSKGCKMGFTNGAFNYPWGIAVSPDGSLIAVGDTRNHRIQLFDADGNFLRQYRTSPHARQRKDLRHIFDYPRGLAFNNTGDKLYITDFNLHSLFELDVMTMELTTLVPSGILRRPSGVTVDPAGNIIVADSRQNNLVVFSSAGQLLSRISSVTGNSPLDQPSDITLMKAGFLAVLDLNGRLTIF